MAFSREPGVLRMERPRFGLGELVDILVDGWIGLDAVQNAVDARHQDAANAR